MRLPLAPTGGKGERVKPPSRHRIVHLRPAHELDRLATAAAGLILAVVIPIPLSDENPTENRPVVTTLIIVANALFWLYEVARGVTLSVLDYGVIPRWFLHGVTDGTIQLAQGTLATLHQEAPWPLTLFTAMFAHGSWMHIIGNMWFLWIFGDNLEDRMGKGRYLLFYLLCGVVAALAQVFATPDSMAPMVGASGAIAGVLGGYILLYPQARVKCLWILFVFITTVRIPAWILLGVWFLSQFLTPLESGVAWVAHVGGFLAGLALVKLFVKAPPPRPAHRVPAYAVWGNDGLETREEERSRMRRGY
jgi:membrane associated rhomboid family serine protease